MTTIDRDLTAPSVVIDCSAAALLGKRDELLAWVESCPERTRIHVYLPSAKKMIEDQQLQRKLLSLGCTVTARSSLRMSA